MYSKSMTRASAAILGSLMIAATFTATTPAIAAGNDRHATTTTNKAVALTVTGGQALTATNGSHGSVSIVNNQVVYTPQSGYVGSDAFTYSITDAAEVYQTHVAPLATNVGGLSISGGAYGSSVVADPKDPTIVYGLTDRGPNVDGPDGVKVEPLPDFVPSIGKFKLNEDGSATLLQRIELTGTDGKAMNGLVDPDADTAEKIVDLNGKEQPKSDHGLDSEGLVLDSDGTFWVSDEYGPFIVHFDAQGKEIGRLSPYQGTLPGELKYRQPNRGMEGLTLTPDGTTLVGSMQGALQINGSKPKASKIPFLRIVTIDKATLKTTHEYTYVLDDPATNGTAVSEITALSDHQFLVDERDGNFEPNAYKKVFAIDTTGATDILNAEVSGLKDDTTSADQGLLIDGKPLEALFGSDKGDIADLSTEGETILKTNGITPVSKTLYFDLGAYVSAVSDKGTFFGHDKIEGIYPLSDGRLLISNDSDFGIDGLADPTSTSTLLEGDALNATQAPYTLHAKLLPNGSQDDGAYMIVNVEKANQTITGNNPARQVTVNVTVSADGNGTSAPKSSGTSNGGITELSQTGSSITPLVVAIAILLAGSAITLVIRKANARR